MTRRLLSVCVIGLLAVVGLAGGETPSRSDQVRTMFSQPPRGYSSGPLWVWNDLLTETQIRETLRDMAGQHVRQVFVHPRPGLMTPYLSADWFRLWKVALDEAERLDMNVWIYDENSYPSGFAGGLVPDAMPESRGKGLSVQEGQSVPKLNDDIVAVFREADGAYENITQKIRAGEQFGEGRYLVASVRPAPQGGWFGGKWYVDLLKPGVTQKFLEITMDAYRREVGDHFGKRVPGVFTDEPHLAPAGGLHWSDDLSKLFQERWGYDLVDHLPQLVRPVGDWKRVRHNYYNLLLELFIERWAKPFYEYCEKYNLEFTGHYWEHGWPGAGHGGDNMAMYAWHQRPAIDTLMNQYNEGVNSQFGNVRAVKELSSIANQFGRDRTLCEAYGAGGWDLRFEDMKRIGDWLYVLGVNTLNEHLSYITIRGARKRDHPQSFSYHTPWWRAYHVMADYFTRLSLVLSSGEQINDILLLEPTTTTWMYQGDGGQLGRIGTAFQNMVLEFERAQIEYDIGCEDVIGRVGSVKGSSLVVGRRRYRMVILPPHTENLNSKTMELLEKYLDNGGHVLCCGEQPRRIGGRQPDRYWDASAIPNWKRTDPVDVVRALTREQSGFRIERTEGDRGILFHHRRRLKDGEFLFLVNTSIDVPSSGSVIAAKRSVQQWDLETGEVRPYRSEDEESVIARFALPPCGSLLLWLSDKPGRPAPVRKEKATTVAPKGDIAVRRLGPNVLTVDYVDITADDETTEDIYFYRANQFAWQKNGMPRNPWDSAVQFKDELITKTFPADSGFGAGYKFTIAESVPTNLAIVIERPDLYSITCNGKTVSAEAGSWWLDKAFGKIDIRAAAKVGENVVTIKARPFTIYHELEPAYVLGDFRLEASEVGFVITPDKPLEIAESKERAAHEVNPDGTMWLSGGVHYEAGVEDRAPFVVFDLGEQTNLAAIKIWNYNESHVRDLTARGAKDVEITASASQEGGPLARKLGGFQLARANAGSPAEVIEVAAEGVRFVRFRILSNHHGVTYPASGEPTDNGFVGLAEVEFIAKARNSVRGVTIHQVSGELASHRRLARHLVDRSGLVEARPGWNLQGHPFYGGDVSYRQRFEVSKPKGRYVVSLPSWYGSVAEVVVNGESGGYIGYRPWEKDVTGAIKAGVNTIDVVVIGTLKNTLGPHHGGATLGAAWPNMFHRGPETGPPAGRQYHTVGYGLFEPFVLQNVVEDDG